MQCYNVHLIKPLYYNNQKMKIEELWDDTMSFYSACRHLQMRKFKHMMSTDFLNILINLFRDVRYCTNEIQLFILCPCNICGAERADVQRNTNGWFLIEIILVFFLFVDRYIYLISCHHTYSFIRYFSKLCSSSDKHIDINTLYRGSEGA